MKIRYVRHVGLKSLLVLGGMLFLHSNNSLKAQENTATITADSTAAGNTSELLVEPGALFDVNTFMSPASVATVSGTALSQIPAANLSNTLYGRLPGLMILQGSGRPGYDAATLRIRGAGTYNSQTPAVFVDGFETNFSYVQYLAPNAIESISVLKDAAALAPFGMKGANGVLWITTRRGQAGEPQVQVQTSVGFQQPIHINKPLGSYDYASLYNEAVSNDNGRVWNPVYSDDQLQAFQSGNGTNVDWYDQVLREHAPYTATDITFSGGDDFTRYFVLLGYQKKQGAYDVTTDDLHSNASHERFNIRANMDFNLFEIFEGQVNLGGRVEDRRYPNYDSSSLWSNLARYPSNIYPARNDNGTWTGTSIYPDNPLASIRALGYRSNHDRTLQANFKLKEDLDFLTEGLYLSQGVSFNNWTRGTYNKTKNYARFIGGVQQTNDQNTTYDIFDDSGTNQWDWKQFTGTIGYEREFDEHSLTAAVKFLQSIYKVDAELNGAAGPNIIYAYQNVGGRIHYAYEDRYVAEFGFAYSGSDNYAKGNRWGFYPALSAAWIISNESFFGSSENINYLKLRASAGKTANNWFGGGRYLYQGYYVYSGEFNTGSGSLTGNDVLIQSYVANPDIFAEESMKYNLGLDAGLFQKLDLTLDVFLDKRSGIVTQDNALSAVFGAVPPYANVGEVTNKGLEISINYNNNTGKLGYFIGGTALYNSNKIDYMAEVITVPGASLTGNRIGTPFGLKADGFYGVDDFDPDGSLKDNLSVPNFGAVQPGDMKYVDINGDNQINQRDVVKIGNSYLPKLTYSLIIGANYGGFDLQILFQGASGRSVNSLHAWNQTVAFVDNGNVYKLARGRWAYYPDQGIDTRATATYPRLTTQGNTNNYRNSTFWMKNGNFLRLRNAEIGYTLPASLTGNVGIPKIRFFVHAMNAFTWSPLLRDYNIDPETMNGYPALKSFTGGVTINF